MTYKCPECQQESELYDLQHLAAVSIRNDLEPDVIMVQVDIECPRCSEIVLTHVMALNDFSRNA